MLMVLWMATAWALGACILYARVRVIARRRVGQLLHAERGPVLARVLYAVLCSGALVVVALSGLGIFATGAWTIAEVSHPHLIAVSLIVLSVAAALLALSQGGEECGTQGLRSGSWSHSYSDIEEWRLTGEHLRFRVGELWRAVSLPTPLHEEVRGHLETYAGGKESRFSK